MVAIRPLIHTLRLQRLQTAKHHETGGIPAVLADEIVRDRVLAHQPAETELCVVRAHEIVDSTGTHLADRKYKTFQARNIVREFTLLNALAAHEQRHVVLKNARTLDQIGVKRIARLQHLATPGDGRAPDVPATE